MHYVMAKGILSAGGNINLYRGCTHGCIYCDSRSRCYHIDHAFEDVEVKQNAVELLEDALRRRRALTQQPLHPRSPPFGPWPPAWPAARSAAGGSPPLWRSIRSRCIAPSARFL